METISPTSVISSNTGNTVWKIHHQSHSRTTTPWTKEDNKKFENALAYFDEKTPNRWLKIASMIPGKSVHDVINQYRVLVADVSDIEAGLVPVPGYLASSSSSFTLELEDHRNFDVHSKRSRIYNNDHERRKGVPWTEEEHRLFLLGLLKHGKGDWRNISRNFVISKTPTQVASHAQKYYQRQLSSGKDKRRPSIHDITTFDLTTHYDTSSPSYSFSPISNNVVNHHLKLAKPNYDHQEAITVENPMSKKVLEWNSSTTYNGMSSNNNTNNKGLKVFGSDFLIAHPHDHVLSSVHGRYSLSNAASGASNFPHPIINI